MDYIIKKLASVNEMQGMLHLIRELTPDLTEDSYKKMLQEMTPHNYFQVAVFDGEKPVAVSGYWIATKIYCGKYIEIDNFVVDKEYRSRNIGKLLIDWILNEGRSSGCQTALLDAYVENFRAHRFYYREGLLPAAFIT
ncbi:MAG: GNAT family N-acetyltransferase [Bacteroidia bacterium]